MRYALRNKKKIVAALGVDYHSLLIKSLDLFFKEDEPIQEHKYEGMNQKIIHVPNAQPNTDGLFEFAIISKRFDVYHLAYYSAIG